MKMIYKDFQELYATIRGKIIEVKPKERVKKEEPKPEVKEEAAPKKKTSRKKKEE